MFRMTMHKHSGLILLFLFYSNAAEPEGEVLQSRQDVNRAEIYSPQVTNWGTWTPTSFCPKLHYVTGMRLRTERSQGKGDDTALNAIQLICSLYGFSDVDWSITPHSGFWGDWGPIFRCGGSRIAVGFELRSEASQGRGDDTAANNLRLICSNNEILEGDGMSWGSWTGEQRCPVNYFLCGFRVQVENPQGSGDDTALNNLAASCCTLPRSTG